MIFVSWERPRRWAIRVYGPQQSTPRPYQHHLTLGIVALSVDRAVEEAQRLYPAYRVESVNDTGEVTSVVDAPAIELRSSSASEVQK